MKAKFLFLSFLLAAGPVSGMAATCSTANLNRCMDSVCGINLGANPAARCQYCGTSSAGTPPTIKGMRSVSVGQSASTTISDKELKNAPTDPQQRYAWGAAQCIKKLPACTVDDIADNYDKLIEQSCTAAGVKAQLTGILDSTHAAKTATACQTEILACMVDVKRCGPTYTACEADADFDRNFAECAVAATGCDAFAGDIRTTLAGNRDTAIADADAALSGIVAAYQKQRADKLAQIQSGCENNKLRDDCIETVCANNMPNKCGDGYASERASATLMCKFHQLACEKVNK